MAVFAGKTNRNKILNPNDDQEQAQSPCICASSGCGEFCAFLSFQPGNSYLCQKIKDDAFCGVPWDVGSIVPTAAATAVLSKQGGSHVCPHLSHGMRRCCFSGCPGWKSMKTSLLSFSARLSAVGICSQTLSVLRGTEMVIAFCSPDLIHILPSTPPKARQLGKCNFLLSTGHRYRLLDWDSKGLTQGPGPALMVGLGLPPLCVPTVMESLGPRRHGQVPRSKGGTPELHASVSWRLCVPALMEGLEGTRHFTHQRRPAPAQG